MGMYDSIYLKVKCPYCGIKSEIEFQTKDLKCILKSYKLGDDTSNTKLNYLSARGSCYSVICKKYMDKIESKKDCCVFGFGRIFNAKIYLKNGIITNKLEIEKIKSGD